RPRALQPYSQILGELLELPVLRTLVTGHRPGHRLDAMVDVVVKEGALCVGDRLFDRMQLLSEVQTRAPGFDHLDDAAEVAFRTSQPLHNIWVCCVERLICHMCILSWGGDMSSVTLVGLEDSPRHQFIYTSADASRLCRNDGSPAIFTRR